MGVFSASYLEIEPRELVRYLLRSTGQCDRDCVSTRDLLSFLDLLYMSFDFATELPGNAKHSVGGGKPRALLSFTDRIVATDESLDSKRSRFSVLHEIGHYVLPRHEHALYVCDDIGLSFAARLVMEKEASEFAAELLFLGDRFSVEANSRQIIARTVKELASQYSASFEATARRLVEKSFRPCMLVVFKPKLKAEALVSDSACEWDVKYCIASPTFKTTYFERINGSVPDDVASVVTQPGRDIADSVVTELRISPRGSTEEVPFQAEFFSNTYNVFCLLAPRK